MPNADTHFKAGLTTGALVGGLYNGIKQLDKINQNPSTQFDWGEFAENVMTGAFYGGIAAALPDILEPANHPHHRQFFHSITTYGLLCYGLQKVEKSPLEYDEKGMLSASISGYLSHLALDARTAFGLKII